MVAYKPPDHVLISIGASFRSAPLLQAAKRILPLLEEDLKRLGRYGIEEHSHEDLDDLIHEVERLLKDKAAKNKDTPLQMNEVMEIMSRTRAWLKTLRTIASVNLACDAPALERVASAAPELAEGYARDLLRELERKVSAAGDLKPRLEEVGLTDTFVGRGARIAAQLRTAIGAEDVDPESLTLAARRLYMRKSALYLLLKRVSRAGQLAFMNAEERAKRYHLSEIEPMMKEPVFRKKKA